MRFAFVSLGALLLLPACADPAPNATSAVAGIEVASDEAAPRFAKGEYEVVSTTHVLDSAAPSTEKDQVSRRWYNEDELTPDALLKRALPSSCAGVETVREDNVWRVSGRCNTPDGDFRNMPISASVTYYDDEIRIVSQTGLMGMTIEESRTIRRVGE